VLLAWWLLDLWALLLWTFDAEAEEEEEEEVDFASSRLELLWEEEAEEW